ncbi:MAG: ATP-binding protein [Dehalococcoidia bacterium]
MSKQLLHDPITALVELVANAWDAGATTVSIDWPLPGAGPLRVADNGMGMTDDQFQRRWRTLSYNRREEQGDTVRFPSDVQATGARTAFGRNGVGRWAAFCFGQEFLVETMSLNVVNRYRIRRGTSEPFEIHRDVADAPAEHHGTTISVSLPQNTALAPDFVRSQIGMRFLTDPSFEVWVNGDLVRFEDIDNPNFTRRPIEFTDGVVGELVIIDTRATDRTSQQHGVAWHVRGRLVGKCSWEGPRGELILDRRRVAARRFTFIATADHLADADAVKADWSGFVESNEAYQAASKVVYDAIEQFMWSASQADREATFRAAEEYNKTRIGRMSPLEREAWSTFVEEAQEKCPSVREADLLKLSEIMANLELSQSGYELLHQLSSYAPGDLDDLNRILAEWTLDMAKVVLDEIAKRLKLIEELESRSADPSTLEVQELQPLFERGLWIFGPEFESIEYTSNVGMSRVIRELFHVDEQATRQRPDFVVLDDSSVSFHSRPAFDGANEVTGVDSVVIVELKRPGVRLGETEKTQCWNYVKELFNRGLLIRGRTTVRCFLLGSEVEQLESEARQEIDGTVRIQPMLFTTVVHRAKARMLRLHDAVKDAPFLEAFRDELDRFTAPDPAGRSQLELTAGQGQG